MEYQIEYWPLERLIPYARNPRKNDQAVEQVAAAIREFGFRVPVVAKSDGTVIDGHLRLKAAKALNMEKVPVICGDDMTEAQIKAFRISVNRMAELAEWDFDMLKLELEELKEMDFDLELTGLDLDNLTPGGGEEYAPNLIPDGNRYKEQYGIIIICQDENEQERDYQKMVDLGYKCKVVVT